MMKNRLYIIKSRLFVVIVLLLTIGCANMDTSRHWENALSVNTIPAYEEFLKLYPTGRLADKANSNLKSLHYQRADEINTITAVEAFLERYPKGKLSEKASSKLEALDFNNAWETDTIEEYAAFIRCYPDSVLTKVVLLRQEALAFRDVEAAESIIAYEGFLRQYPEGLLADKAKSCLKRLHYEKARETNTIRAFKKFLKLYPEGELGDRVRQALEVPPGTFNTIKKQIESLNSSDPLKRAKGALFLGEVGSLASPSARYLIELLGDYTIVHTGLMETGPEDGVEISISKIATDSLITIGEPSIESLIVALKDDGNEWIVTATIISILKSIKSKSTDSVKIVDSLVYVLKDRESFLFWGSVVKILTDFFPDPRVEDALIEALSIDQHNIIEEALADSDFSPRFEVLLIKKSRERSPGAIRILKYVSNPDAVEVLLDVLRDRDPLIREGASLALQDKKETRVVRALMVTAQNDRITKVRKVAKKSLEHMGITSTVRISDIPSVTPWNIWKDEMERLDDIILWREWSRVDKEDEFSM